uniref:Uncharacterized protein n=2 Tax=Aegilops tauschii subsp. strangulata TaxID=200361 RepID=A0A452Y862_AEGTS
MSISSVSSCKISPQLIVCEEKKIKIFTICFSFVFLASPCVQSCLWGHTLFFCGVKEIYSMVIDWGRTFNYVYFRPSACCLFLCWAAGYFMRAFAICKPPRFCYIITKFAFLLSAAVLESDVQYRISEYMEILKDINNLKILFSSSNS